MSMPFPDNLPLTEQTEILGKFILDEFPGYPNTSGGAIETAIRIMREQSITNARLRAALERIDLATYSRELSVRAIEQIVRAAALTGRADGEV